MTEPDKAVADMPPPDLPPSDRDEEKAFPVRWDGELWERIQEAARILGERENIRVTPTDIIRRGTRREVDAILSAA